MTQLFGSALIALLLLALLTGTNLPEQIPPEKEREPEPATVEAQANLIPPELPKATVRPPAQTWLEKFQAEYFPPTTYPYAREFMKAAHYNAEFIKMVRRKVHPAHAGPINLGQACDLFDYLFSHKIYLEDPVGLEYFASPQEYWLDHRGDCDDMALCLTAACDAIGIFSRVVFTYGPAGGHAHVELYLGKGKVAPYMQYVMKRYGVDGQVHYYKDEHGFNWLNFDLNHLHPGGVHWDGQRKHIYYFPIRHWVDLKN